jgi:hypothetical protein
MELCDDDVVHGDATVYRHTCSVCGKFGQDGELWCRWVRLWYRLTKGAVDGSVRRTVPVIGSISKEGGRRSKLSQKPVKLAVAINFVIWASERLDFKLSVLTRVAVFNSYFSFVVNSRGDQAISPLPSPPLPSPYGLWNGYLILSQYKRRYKCAELHCKLCNITVQGGKFCAIALLKIFLFIFRSHVSDKRVAVE